MIYLYLLLVALAAACIGYRIDKARITKLPKLDEDFVNRIKPS